MRFRAHQVAAALDARLIGPDVDIDGVAFDSRSIRAGQLFVPLVAERDGHEFIPDAITAGAAAYLTSREAVGGTAIVVDDTSRALMALGAWGRGRLDIPVVGITGSVGKTSTKDLAAAALSSSRRTWANVRSFNNEQGLPTTILQAPDDTEVMILEMGMRGPGEIARLCAVGRPTVGIVTRVAEAHSELLGGIDGVAMAKGELVEALPRDGWAILNADDEHVRAMRERASAQVLLFGQADDADVRFGDVQLDSRARATFIATTPWGIVEVRLAVSGRHMVANAAAALSCAGALGLDLGAAADALGAASLSSMRMEVNRLASGAVVVNDAYNANPTSMRAALDALAELPAQRRVAVIGIMAEIDDAVAAHRAIAGYAAALGIELVAVGTGAYGVEPTVDPVAGLASLTGGDAVLVKASRAAGLERVARAIIDANGGVLDET